MAYTKNTWQTGDVVTSAKLNNIENGIAGPDPLVVTESKSGDNYVLDKTWNEIKTAIDANRVVWLKQTSDYGTWNFYIYGYVSGPPTYSLLAGNGDPIYPVEEGYDYYQAVSADGILTAEGGETPT